MKTYTFDYTLPAEAEKMAHQAFLMCQDEEMKKLLEETVMKLRQFLAQDNMVEDEDCEGWVRRWEAEDAIEEARKERRGEMAKKIDNITS